MQVRISTWRGVGAFVAVATTVSVALSHGSALVACYGFGVPVSPVGFYVSIIVPLVVAGPMSFLVALPLRRLTQLKNQLEVLANRDPLTDLLNRRSFFERGREQVRACQDQSRPVSVILFDVDHFKRTNDRYGHAGGDEALRAIGQAVSLRRSDTVGRLGGEEFGIIVDESLIDAGRLAERLRAAVGASTISIGEHRFHVTVSLGVTEVAADESLDDALVRADRALYTAKHAGRDRVVVLSQRDQVLDMAGNDRADGPRRARIVRRTFVN
jgi:diguanylate cyclase (GGDEF)-like protein